MEKTKNQLIVPLTILSIAIIIATTIVAYNFYKIKGLADAISVTGLAQKNIISDVVKWHANFSRNVDAVGLKNGYEQMKKDLEIVKKYLKDNGVADESIVIKPISMNSIYESDKNGYGFSGTIKGYQLMQSVDIESNEVDKITKLAQDSGNLINQGVIFSSQPLEYYYSKLSDLKVQMLAEATKDAKDRAEKIAESAGAKLGNIKAASMGVMQITQVNSTDVSDYGSYDTSSIAKQINAIVRASFTLK